MIGIVNCFLLFQLKTMNIDIKVYSWMYLTKLMSNKTL